MEIFEFYKDRKKSISLKEAFGITYGYDVQCIVTDFSDFSVFVVHQIDEVRRSL